ncbi:tetratricopeptide repeat protein [Rubellicoccus peritrichatus]|uniref:Molecular chaperone DnaJ n=1 Tax=Rubellicoccus peritrichatus TaxID=3080537 RepID=A0AAQ3LA79_9BACT|nr:tetratricopeptide repeat protein [Puniceicoccus sp. CR14]WOO42140.1 molecular chaperone DnaJ [Puniceicoccus sp. CR14]
MIPEVHRQRFQKDPNNPLFRFSLGQALFNDGQFEEAAEHLTFCSNSRDDWMLPRILLGKALIETGNDTEARPYLEKALELAIAQHHEDPEAEVRSLLSNMN